MTNVSTGNDVYAPKTTLPSSVALNNVAETQSTTTFIDGGTKTTALPQTNSIGTAIDRSKNLLVPRQTLADLLSKPHVISSFTWNKTDATKAQLMTVDLPTAVWTGNELLRSKLRYFRSFRGDVHIRVQANPSMAHSGKMLFVFFPFSDKLNYTSRLDHFTSITQLPKVEFDVGTTRTVDFIVPYRLPWAFTNPVNSPPHIYGSVKALVYTPLRGGTTDAVPFTVWAWFEPNTVVLANPTADNDISAEELAALTRRVATKGIKKTAGSLEAEKSSDSHSVSKTLSTVATVATTAAAVPVLTSVAAPVAWAAAIGSGAAAAMGWSNPRQEKAPTLVLDRHTQDLCTADQAVPGYVYSFTGASRVGSERPAGLVQEDELAFGHLLPISVFRETITWESIDPYGRKLIDLEQVDVLLGKSVGTTHQHYAPYTAIATMFYYWRGHIRFTFRLAKSRFHSGRLLVAYDCKGTQNSLNLVETDPLLREIYDLESGNEFTFECPFNANTDYVTAGALMGRLSLFVLTPLAYAGGASDTIDIVVETSMRADASFGYPLGEQSKIITDRTGVLSRKPANKKVIACAGNLKPTMTNTLPSGSTAEISLTNHITTPFADPVDRELACIGEGVRSLRTYIRRGMVNKVTSGELRFLANSLDSVADNNMILYEVAQWYALMRGSIRYTIRAHTSCFLYLVEPASDNPPPPGLGKTGYAQFLHDGVMQSVEVPMFHNNPWRYVADVDTIASQDGEYPLLESDVSTLTYEWLATPADDFDLSFFIGVNPVANP